MADAPEHADPERYAELTGFETGFRDLWWNPDWLGLVAKRWALSDAATVLDVGCGAGEWGRTVVRHIAPQAKITGLDREPVFVDMARKHARDGDNYVVGSAEKIPFEDGAFDLVTCQTLLIHVADASAVVAELKRVTRPGGVVLVAEPDNLAGGIALLGGEPAMSDDDVQAITSLLLRCHRGKASLGEGDERVGARLPGVFAAAGLSNVMAATSDRCISLVPPYQTETMRIALEQERAWIRQDVSMLVGSHGDALRLFVAGGGDQGSFDAGWAAVSRWMKAVDDGVAQGTYHAARGFVMYLVGGRRSKT